MDTALWRRASHTYERERGLATGLLEWEDRLGAIGRCIFAMRVTSKINFDEYWSNPMYLAKRPVRNGSRKMLVGDNIYRYDSSSKQWRQADSHHSNADGSANFDNLNTDTQSDDVLISRHFFYFGREAPMVPTDIIDDIGFKNCRNHRVFNADMCVGLISWLETDHHEALNIVTARPFDFDNNNKRYSGRGSKII